MDGSGGEFVGEVIKPQPGPQERFLGSSADIAIYGGAAGGGKSWALLMEPLRHIHNGQFGAVFFRRTTVQVRNEGGLWDESMKLYPLLGAEPKEHVLTWAFPSGATVSFAHLEHDKTVLNWQGSQIPLVCCEVGTPVLTPRGPVPVEALRAGDEVLTLQGPRKVMKAHAPTREPCVVATVFGSSGEMIGRQVHAQSHRILTPRGWRSYDDMCGEPRPSSTCGSMECRCARRSAEPCDTKSPSHGRLPDSRPCRSPRPPEPSRSPPDRQCELATCACTARRGQGSCCGSCPCSSPEPGPRASIRLPAVLAVQPLAQEGRIAARAPHFDGASCVPGASSAEGCPDRCSACRRPCGGPEYPAGDIRQSGAQRQAGAAERIQMDWPWDDPGTAQRHSRHRSRYAHPYTGEERTAAVASELGSCEMAPCGERNVIHLAIEGEAHYITASGVVNQNCFDELTHFSEAQFWYMVSRNRSMCGVRPYIRATCNPDSDSWVAKFIEWWIDQETGLPIPDRAGVIRWFVRVNNTLFWADDEDELCERFPGIPPKSATFVPAKLSDNAALMAADPGYLANLMSLPQVERERLLGGNWKIRAVAGMFFRRDWFKRYRVGDEPKNLRRYITSDHAPTTSEDSDPSTARVFGVDANSDIWYLDGFSHRETMDVTSDKIVGNLKAHKEGRVEPDSPLYEGLIRRHEPFAWFPEDDNNWKTAEPFIVRRMKEEGVVTIIAPMSPHGHDKAAKAQSAQGMAAMGRVWVPYGSEGDAIIDQLEAFAPGAVTGHDEEVDCLAIMGRAIAMAHPAIVPPEDKSKEAPRGIEEATWDELIASQQPKRDRV